MNLLKRLFGAAGLACLSLSAWVPQSATASDELGRALQARAAILVEASTGKTLFEKAADRRLPIASTTKLMTALVTLQSVSLDDTFSAATYQAGPAETVLGLKQKERMRVKDLLRALLLASANDAAVTLAEGVAGSRERFVALMNRQAKLLDLDNTHYATPVGLDAPGNFSTARDLASLTRRLRKNEFFRRTVGTSQSVLYSGSRQRTVRNRNQLVEKVPYVDGVKTGRTLQAGYVLVGSATRNGMGLISVVMGEPSEQARQSETLKLFSYGFDNYRVAQLMKAGRRLESVPIKYKESKLQLVAKRNVRTVVRRGARVTTSVLAPGSVEGPIRKGAVVGTVTVRVGGTPVARVPLVAATTVSKATFFERFRARIEGRLALVLLIFVACFCGAVIVASRHWSFWRRNRVRRVEQETGR